MSQSGTLAYLNSLYAEPDTDPAMMDMVIALARMFSLYEEETKLRRHHRRHGAGGGTMAYALAPSGRRILLLERGDFLPREKDTWNPKAVTTEGRYLAKDSWYTPDGKPFRPYIYYWVGGNTKFYGAALLHARERVFGEVHHAGGTGSSSSTTARPRPSRRRSCCARPVLDIPTA